MIIRKAELEDVEQLDMMFAKLLEIDKIYDDNLKSGLTMHGFFSKRIMDEDVIAFVAFDNDNIIGYVFGYIQKDNKVKVELEAYIESIYIEESKRKTGIGTKLIEQFELEAQNRGVKYIFIDNKVNNLVAHNLYSNLGYNLFIESRRKEI